MQRLQAAIEKHAFDAGVVVEVLDMAGIGDRAADMCMNRRRGMGRYRRAVRQTQVSSLPIRDPREAEAIARRALECDGPAVTDCVVDKTEPPTPRNISFKQAVHLAESLARGEKYTKEIIKTVVENKVKEIV